MIGSFDLSRPALRLGEGVASLLFALFTTLALTFLFLPEAPKLRSGFLSLMAPAKAERYARVMREISRSVSGHMLGSLLTSLIAGLVVLITLLALGVPYPFLWGLWVPLVGFLPMIGGALAGIPTVLFALVHSLTADIVTIVVFVVYTQVENHFLNPVVMSRTVRINPAAGPRVNTGRRCHRQLAGRPVRRIRRRPDRDPGGSGAADSRAGTICAATASGADSPDTARRPT